MAYKWRLLTTYTYNKSDDPPSNVPPPPEIARPLRIGL